MENPLDYATSKPQKSTGLLRWVLLCVAGSVLLFVMLSWASPDFAYWVSETRLFGALPDKLQDAYAFFFGLLNQV